MGIIFWTYFALLGGAWSLRGAILHARIAQIGDSLGPPWVPDFLSISRDPRWPPWTSYFGHILPCWAAPGPFSGSLGFGFGLRIRLCVLFLVICSSFNQMEHAVTYTFGGSTNTQYKYSVVRRRRRRRRRLILSFQTMRVMLWHMATYICIYVYHLHIFVYI